MSELEQKLKNLTVEFSEILIQNSSEAKIEDDFELFEYSLITMASTLAGVMKKPVYRKAWLKSLANNSIRRVEEIEKSLDGKNYDA